MNSRYFLAVGKQEEFGPGEFLEETTRDAYRGQSNSFPAKNKPF